MGREFKFRQVTPGSIFHNSSETGSPDVANDVEYLRGQLRDNLALHHQEQLSGKVEIPWIRPDIWPGDIVVGVSGREVDFCKITVDGFPLTTRSIWFNIFKT